MSAQDLSFFAGRELLQVCVGANELILNFEGEISILVASEIEICIVGYSPHRSEKFREMASEICSFVGTSVRFAEVKSQTAMRLEFSNENSLIFIDNSTTYESFTITYPEGIIVV